MPVVDSNNIRNVALISHSGTGKTSLVEAMLMASGAITRLGNVEDGTTTSDYEPEELKRKSSIQTSVAPCTVSGRKLNFLDVPGYPDFVGEAVSALEAADAAVLLVAAQAGVEVGTENAWAMCEARGLPRIIFVNKMDRENADFLRSLESVRSAFGRKCVPIQAPVGAEQEFKSVVSLLGSEGDVPAEMEELREQLVEAVAETDDDLATKYLEGEAITNEDLASSLKKAVLTGDIVPVLAGSSTTSVGVEEFMNAVVDLLPSPLDSPPVEAEDGAKIEADSSGPLVAHVFKTTADPFVGKLSYFKVIRGTFKADSQVLNASKSQDERIGQIFVPLGKNQQATDGLAAGDIGAVSKLTATVTGDTLCQKDEPVKLSHLEFPQPLFSAAITPKGKADVDKMASSLARLTEEDPTLSLTRSLDTAETLLSGIGETHIDVALEKVKRKFGVELFSSLPRVPYKETVSSSTKTEYRHKKQTGGHGQFGHVMIELQPLPRGSGFEFTDTVVGGNVPKEYIPSVQKGVVKSLDEGPLSGSPIVDLKVVLYDGSSHPVDSSGMSFEIAGSYALRKGVELASPVLLEPVMKLEIAVPDSYTGDIIGDLNTKRARILGMNPADGVTLIQAEAPQSEVQRYATELRSMTQGRGSFTMVEDHFEEVPQHITQRIVEDLKREKVAVS